MTKKPTLGRGLADLLGQAAARAPAKPVAVPVASAGAPAGTSAGKTANAAAAEVPRPAGPAGEALARLPIDLLQRGRYQPRTDMREESLEELAGSIRSQGVIQPIVVRPLAGQGSGPTQRYEIIAGERRWRAAQIAGLADIPAVIREVPDEAAIAMALIENIQRENLNPLEEARALERLIAEFGVTHQQAADAVGRSRAAVSNLLRLLDLAPEAAALVESRRIEMGHARALLGLPQRRQQAEVAAIVASRGLSVRDTEALVRRMVTPAAESSAATAETRDPNVRKLEQDLAEKLGARVAIQQGSGGKGKLVVSYNSLDELDGILAHFQ